MCHDLLMTAPSTDVAAADGRSTGRLRLPAFFVQAGLPILAYAFVARGATVADSWTVEESEAGMQSSLGISMRFELFPSVWIVLLCIAVSVGFLAASKQAAPRRARELEIASIISVWVIVALATFGGWAWLAIVSTVGTDIGIPFPLMGTVSPLQ